MALAGRRWSRLRSWPCPANGYPAAGGWLGPVALVPVFWFTARHGPWWSLLGGALWITLVTAIAQSWLLSFHHPRVSPDPVLPNPVVRRCFCPVIAAVARSRRFMASGPAVDGLRIPAQSKGFFSFPTARCPARFWTWPVTFQSADPGGNLEKRLTLLLAWVSAPAGQALLRLPAKRLPAWRALAFGAAALGRQPGLRRLVSVAARDRRCMAAGPRSAVAGSRGQEDLRPTRAGFETLASLSERALSLDPKPDAVIWPGKTAFVPSVEYHNKYHDSPDSVRLVKRLETFSRNEPPSPSCWVTTHREKTFDGTTRSISTPS